MSRSQSFAAISIGDLIYGLGDDGRPDLLLVHKADSTSLLARNVPNQSEYRFARDGEGRRIQDGRACTIVSTAALPAEQYQVAIGLDRRMGSKPEYPDTRLTEEEVQLILSYDRFFEKRLLPGTEPLVRRAQKLREVEELLMLDWDPVHAKVSPPSPYQYSNNISALVSLLERAPSKRDVANFLANIADQHQRSSNVLERTNAAAEGLMRLRATWT